jgi:hypothetical protein
VQLLLDPATAQRDLPADLRPLRANQVTDLHPAIKAAVREQPELSGWTPSQLCLFYFALVELPNGKAQNKDYRKSPLVGMWTAAAADARTGSRRDGAVQFFSGNSKVVTAANRANVEIKEIRSVMGKVPIEDDDGVPSDEDRYRIKLGNTLVTWDGHPTGDSTRAEATLSHSWVTPSRRGGVWETRLTLTPEWTRGMAGAFRVEGKDPVAKALRGSPIRFVGPLYLGGGGELSFSRPGR